ncbi:FixH family protein [Sediminibacterium goheungense]|uniref:FixH protein n=1 Tax=Sediminibacterium goheungense TaxID=1086393 RepID=A0A4R6IX17_9BACT|nr:FixH family protein [Sediminibacterium goheungense]TDO26435.1 FixH protein [Sediminibacterium goheungense]
MNWGNKLMLVFIGFAALMATLVYKAVNTKYELVSKEYYQDELRYQDKIDGRKNAASIGELTVTYTKENLAIQFPKEMLGMEVKGEAWFYCKTAADKDIRLPLAPDREGIQIIERNKLPAEKYLLKISWEAADKKYYLEKELEPTIQ